MAEYDTNNVMHKYKSPKISIQNQVSFTCSDTAVENILEILKHLEALGNMGMSRHVIIDGFVYSFDGDGSDKLDYIKINGLSLAEWQEETNRLNKVRERQYGRVGKQVCGESPNGNGANEHGLDK